LDIVRDILKHPNALFAIGFLLACVLTFVIYWLSKQHTPIELRIERDPDQSQSQNMSPTRFGTLIGLDRDVVGRTYPIPEEGLVLGRDPQKSQVLSANTAVSHIHAHILPFEGDVMVFDAHSKNGTYVNGRRVIDAILNDGDKVSMGKRQPTTFVFRR